LPGIAGQDQTHLIPAPAQTEQDLLFWPIAGREDHRAGLEIQREIFAGGQLEPLNGPIRAQARQRCGPGPPGLAHRL